MAFQPGYQFFPQGGNSAPLGPLGPQRDPRSLNVPQRPQMAPRPLPMPVPPGGGPQGDPRLTGLDRARQVASPNAAFMREGGQASEHARFNRPEMAQGPGGGQFANNPPGQRPASGPRGFDRALVPGSEDDMHARRAAVDFVNRLMVERPDMIARLIQHGGASGPSYGGDMVAQPMPVPGGNLPYGNDMIARPVSPTGGTPIPGSPGLSDPGNTWNITWPQPQTGTPIPGSPGLSDPGNTWNLGSVGYNQGLYELLSALGGLPQRG